MTRRNRDSFTPLKVGIPAATVIPVNAGIHGHQCNEPFQREGTKSTRGYRRSPV